VSIFDIYIHEFFILVMLKSLDLILMLDNREVYIRKVLY